MDPAAGILSWPEAITTLPVPGVSVILLAPVELRAKAVAPVMPGAVMALLNVFVAVQVFVPERATGVVHVGAPAPPEVKTCPAVPGANKAKADAVEEITPPFAAVIAAPVP